MNKKIRKILIVQLSIVEVILLILLVSDKQTSCIIEKENNNLLVYNYNSSTLLAPKLIKEEIEVLTEDKIEVSEEIETENNEKQEEVKEEVEEVVEVANIVYTPETIQDVNYTIAENLVAYAKQFVGYPYVYGGNSLTGGTDCSGFTKLIYANYGIDLPRVAYDQSFVGVEVPISDIQIGDLVLSGYNGTTHHVAIYIGDGQLVHALNSNVGIVITDLYIMPITHIRRVL